MPAKSSGSVKAFYRRYQPDDLVAIIRERAEALARQLPLKFVALFGSQVTGRSTAFSDIDVLIVYTGPARSDAYSLVRRGLAMRGLEPHIYTEEEAESIAPVIERMLRDSITVWSRT